MKYRLNFSSYDRKAERRKKISGRLLIALILIFATSMLYGLYRATDIRQQTAKVAANRESLAQKVEKDRTERRKIISDDEVAVLENRLKFYRELTKPRLYPTVFMNFLEQKTPAIVSMKAVEYDPLRKNFTLVCESFVPDAVAGFIPALEGGSLVKRLQITRHNIQKIPDKKQIISEFELKGETF